MARQLPEGSKATHRRRRRKPAPAPAAVVEPESTSSRSPETVPATESTFFVYTYTVWNRFPNVRDN